MRPGLERFKPIANRRSVKVRIAIADGNRSSEFGVVSDFGSRASDFGPLARRPNFHHSASLDIRGAMSYVLRMGVDMPVVLPDTEQTEQTESQKALEPGYLVSCGDDPVNIMDYVTHVFQTVFAWSKSKAEYHMLQVHNHGKSVLTRESMEMAEHYVHQLQKYSLHATMEREE
jgi:ATP-dependent Clp protease adaptor protein ClpS